MGGLDENHDTAFALIDGDDESYNDRMAAASAELLGLARTGLRVSTGSPRAAGVPDADADTDVDADPVGADPMGAGKGAGKVDFNREEAVEALEDATLVAHMSDARRAAEALKARSERVAASQTLDHLDATARQRISNLMAMLTSLNTLTTDARENLCLEASNLRKLAAEGPKPHGYPEDPQGVSLPGGHVKNLMALYGRLDGVCQKLEGTEQALAEVTRGLTILRREHEQCVDGYRKQF